MSPDPFQVWLVIIVMGVATFALRFSFLGLIGSRDLPPFVMRLLRYTAVAVLPALVTPLILWPAATGGSPDAARLAAAGVTLLLGVTTRNVLLSIFGGVVTLYGVMALAG